MDSSAPGGGGAGGSDRLVSRFRRAGEDHGRRGGLHCRVFTLWGAASAAGLTRFNEVLDMFVFCSL